MYLNTWEVKNDKFSALSSEVKRLKETEGDVQVMSEVMQRYINLAIHKENIERIQKMIGKGYSKEDILDLDYIEDEYTEAEAALLQKD